LLKKLRSKILINFALYFFIIPAAFSVEWSGELKKNSEHYLQVFRDFRSRVCSPGDEQHFNKLIKRYRGQGYWIPELNGDVDVEALRFIIPEIELKISWIQKEKNKILKLKDLSPDGVMNLKKLFKELVSLRNTELQSDENQKIKARKKSLELIEKLKKEYSKLTSKFAFLTNYRFPVDHLKNRKVYDLLKEMKDVESIQSSNRAFLTRKVMEDGTYLKNHTSSDIYFRTTLDTLFFELNEHDFYLSESARYDLEFVIQKLDFELNKGVKYFLERFTEWEDRTIKTLKFYQSLTLDENTREIIVNGKKTSKNKLLIAEHNQATEALKDFVYNKQAEVYKYWLSKTELEKAIFVVETILMNEVGNVDGEDALERMDVARVVMNRLEKPNYNRIEVNDFVFPYIRSLTQDSKIAEEKWLNILFKQGEFSFTYYYMSGSVNVFCPDIAKEAAKLRKQNIEIALLALKEDQTQFKTTRYFSRASMIGRIHMDSIWEDYVPYPERAGLMVSGQETLLSAFKKGNFTFLYSFKDHESREFKVLQIQGKNYALGELNGVHLFYQHRNPHYFRYFSKADTASN